MNTDSRIDQFKQEVADLKVKTSGGAGEAGLFLAGVILMAAGVVLAIGSFVQANNEGIGKGTTDEILLASLNQNQEIILAIVGLALAVVGASLFLVVSMKRFWRFWMLRNLYESRARSEER